MTRPEVLISAYLDGELPDSEVASLSDWIAADPAHAEEFAIASFLHSRISDELRSQDLRSLLQHRCGLDVLPSHIESLLDEEAEAEERREAELAAERRRLLAEQEARRRELSARGDGAQRGAATVIPQTIAYVFLGAAAAALFFVVSRLLPLVEVMSASGPSLALSQPARPQLPVVAEVAKSLDANWARGSQAGDRGAKFVAGRLELLTGVVELKFADDARLIVEAPAAMELISANRVRVTRGKVVARVPEQAIGFTVLSGRSAIVDLGTEFGVAVAEDGETSVQVLDGEVALVPGGQQQSSSVKIAQGSARAVTGDGVSVREIDYDREAFIRRVPVSRYELAVLQSRPLAYWRLNEALDATTVRSVGRLALKGDVRSGVARDGNAHQADENSNAGLAASGSHLGVEIEPNRELALTESYSIEAWVMTSPAVDGPQRFISSFNETPKGGFAFGVVDNTWGGRRVPPPIALHFTMYGVTDVATSYAIEPNRWVHAVATVDADGAVALYLDGQAVPVEIRDEASTEPWRAGNAQPAVGGGLASAGPLYLGRNPADSAAAYPPEAWQGRFDEVALYDRVLPPEEVLRHFEAHNRPSPPQAAL